MATDAQGEQGLTNVRIMHLQKAKGIGGSERHIIDLSRGMAERGAQPSILWLTERGHPLDALLALCREAEIAADCLPIGGHLDPLLPRRLRRALHGSSPAIVHLHLIHATLYGAFAARAAGVRAVFATRHSDEPYQRHALMRRLARAGDARCDRIIAPSQHVADYCRRFDGTPPAKLRVIRHGIDLERFDPDPAVRVDIRAAWRIAPDAIVAGYVARLHPSKDHDTLLRAFAHCAAECPTLHLVLLGDGPRRGELRALARSLPGRLGERILFLPERPDVAAVLAGLDIAVIATHREGFCLSALEAMAAGLPVIATDIGPLPELITKEETGLLTPPADAAALAAALARLARDRALRNRLGARAARAAATYTRERMVTETAALYREVLGGSVDARGGGA